MSDAAPLPHDWQDVVRYSVAIIIGSIITYLVALLNKRLRKKQTSAEVEKTVAETRGIDLDVLIKLSVETDKLIDRLLVEKDFQQARADRLQRELNDLRK